MTFNPVAYDSTLEPSAALLAEHQLQLQETYLVFYCRSGRSLQVATCSQQFANSNHTLFKFH